MKKREESKENSYDITFKIVVFGDSSKTSVIQRYLICYSEIFIVIAKLIYINLTSGVMKITPFFLFLDIYLFYI